ncbi:MAG: hypothetical protein Q4F13_10115 [Pseudomonadota bacterium]|nr:hypothetical protein [Pseudomonadota bacterium]
MESLLKRRTPTPAHEPLLQDLLSPSGYMRERALLDMGPQHASAAVWRAVLLRLNDWVPQVRAAAWQAFEKLLPQLDLDTALQLLPAQALEQQAQLETLAQQLHARWLSVRPVFP